MRVQLAVVLTRVHLPTAVVFDKTVCAFLPSRSTHLGT
jgi:hypothetical protein